MWITQSLPCLLIHVIIYNYTWWLDVYAVLLEFWKPTVYHSFSSYFFSYHLGIYCEWHNLKFKWTFEGYLNLSEPAKESFCHFLNLKWINMILKLLERPSEKGWITSKKPLHCFWMFTKKGMSTKWKMFFRKIEKLFRVSCVPLCG